MIQPGRVVSVPVRYDHEVEPREIDAEGTDVALEDGRVIAGVFQRYFQLKKYKVFLVFGYKGFKVGSPYLLYIAVRVFFIRHQHQLYGDWYASPGQGGCIPVEAGEALADAILAVVRREQAPDPDWASRALPSKAEVTARHRRPSRIAAMLTCDFPKAT